jgi:hypothetical protein
LERLLHDRLKDKGDTLLKELESLWDQCHTPQEERDCILHGINIGILLNLAHSFTLQTQGCLGHYNNRSLLKLAQAIQEANQQYNRIKGMLELVDKRKQLIQVREEWREVINRFSD